ncbi:unnamed protein product [Prorocentrum cordatum]|uniref:Uncharacterized protein n=1 Tax=Prorocentrum cordatum TaxID=2364126 RepID=A0ABN9V288_9DINO|nr:unnamed protein product [Polarella glacialis]
MSVEEFWQQVPARNAALVGRRGPTGDSALDELVCKNTYEEFAPNLMEGPFDTFEACPGSDKAWAFLELFYQMIGPKLAVPGGPKSPLPADQFKLLGTWSDLSASPREIRALLARIDAICSVLSSLHGKLAFASGQRFGRFGRVHLGLLKWRQYSRHGNDKLNDSILVAIKFWLGVLPLGPFRVVLSDWALHEGTDANRQIDKKECVAPAGRLQTFSGMLFPARFAAPENVPCVAVGAGHSRPHVGEVESENRSAAELPRGEDIEAGDDFGGRAAGAHGVAAARAPGRFALDAPAAAAHPALYGPAVVVQLFELPCHGGEPAPLLKRGGGASGPAVGRRRPAGRALLGASRARPAAAATAAGPWPRRALLRGVRPGCYAAVAFVDRSGGGRLDFSAPQPLGWFGAGGAWGGAASVLRVPGGADGEGPVIGLRHATPPTGEARGVAGGRLPWAVQGLTVLHLWGAPAERGRAQGRLLGRQVLDFLEFFIIEDLVGGPAAYSVVHEAFASGAFAVGEAFMKECQGMVAGIVEATDGGYVETLGRRVDEVDIVCLNAPTLIVERAGRARPGPAAAGRQGRQAAEGQPASARGLRGRLHAAGLLGRVHGRQRRAGRHRGGPQQPRMRRQEGDGHAFAGLGSGAGPAGGVAARQRNEMLPVMSEVRSLQVQHLQSSVRGPRPKIQRMIVNKLSNCMYSNSLGDLFSRRLLDLLPEERARILTVDWSAVQTALASLPVAHSAAAARTLSKNWLTQRRFQQSANSHCLCGCPPDLGGEDAFAHYWNCPIFGTLLEKLTGPLAPLPLDRFGILAPTQSSLRVPATAYFLYNEIRAMSSRLGGRPLELDEARDPIAAVQMQMQR